MDNINKYNEQPKALIKDLNQNDNEKRIEKKESHEINQNKENQKEKQNNLTSISSDLTNQNDINIYANGNKQIKIIEDILSEDLGVLYKKLPSKKQQEFKIKGEETAKKISSLLQKGRIKFKEILNLIKKWLKLIPGVNNFYLEQESKIKTYKIIKYNQNKRK